jgi:hypothetical protein
MRLVLAILFLLIFSVAFAAAEASTPALGTPEDNACNPGGPWDDGRCNIPQIPGATELAWECGWYFARIRAGTLPQSALHDDCAHLLVQLRPGASGGGGGSGCLEYYDPIAVLNVRFCVTGSAYEMSYLLGEEAFLLEDGVIVPPGAECPAPYTDEFYPIQFHLAEIVPYLYGLGFSPDDIICRRYA